MADGTKPRNRTIKMGEEHRDKIRNSKILQVLIEHAEGKREISASQVTAGLGLLRKCLPDLQSMTVQGDDDGGPVRHKVTISFD